MVALFENMLVYAYIAYTVIRWYFCLAHLHKWTRVNDEGRERFGEYDCVYCRAKGREKYYRAFKIIEYEPGEDLGIIIRKVKDSHVV